MKANTVEETFVVGPGMPTIIGMPHGPSKLVPLKRGIWFRWNANKWHSLPIIGAVTFFELYVSRFVFGFVVFNFTLNIFLIDPDGPPMTIDQNGNAMGFVHSESPVTSHQSPVTLPVPGQRGSQRP